MYALSPIVPDPGTQVYIDISPFWIIMKSMVGVFMLLWLTASAAANIDMQCSTIAFGDGQVYCAPFSGSSFYRLLRDDSLLPVTFSDDQNYRIIDFQVMPFTVYLYNGVTIDRFYPASGDKIPVYASRDISAFVVTPWEELIIADRRQRELIFLDFNFEVKFRVHDLNVRDICMSGQTLAILTGQSVLVCDEICSERQTIPLPGPCDRIISIDGEPAVYLTNTNSIFLFHGTWREDTLPHTIQDIACSDSSVYILGDDGFTLYYYSVSSFR